jgi:hypothetical protein
MIAVNVEAIWVSRSDVRLSENQIVCLILTFETLDYT